VYLGLTRPLSTFALMLALALPLAAQNRAAGVQTAMARARHLQHGINSSDWFAQSSDYSTAHINQFIDAQDIALIAHLGFDHVRIAVDPVPLERDPRDSDGLNAEFIGSLDRAVDSILAGGLTVLIDLHPEDIYKQPLRNSNDATDRLAMLWRKFAAHYANRDPDRVFFEILNEPGVSDRHRWAEIQTRIAAAIRGAAQHSHRRGPKLF